MRIIQEGYIMNRKGSGLVYLLITALILALIAMFMFQSMKPAQTNPSGGNNAVQQAQEAVEQINDRLNQYE